MERVRLSKSSVGEEEKRAVARVIDSAFLGMGEEVGLFEREIRELLGTSKEVVCVNTGTAALQLAVESLGIGPGDEVLVPSLTYVASFQAVAATGATPVACDIDPDTVFVDLGDAEKRLSPATRAIMPVHYASDSRDMPAVYTFAEQHGVRVVEDAAHSFGCERDGRKIGVEGDVLCFSFDGIKNITSGEGGAILSDDPEVVARARDGRLLGVERDTERRLQGERSWEFDVQHVGHRFHMSNIMAAIGRAQLAKLPAFAERRRAICRRYLEAFGDHPGLSPLALDFANNITHIFPIRVLDGRRDALRKHLLEKQIESGNHYLPNHLLSRFRTEYALPHSERFFAEVVTLPLHPEVTDDQVERVVSEVLAFLS